MFKSFKFYLFPILSGIFVGTSYIPCPPWALAFCYVPVWLFAIRTASNWKQIFWAGWWTQFLLSMIGFHWIASTAHDFGYLPWAVSILILFVFSAFMHLYIPLGMVIAYWIARKFNLKSGAMLLLFACFIVVGEMYWPSIFQWNIGYPLLWARFPLFQWADTIGFQGLSLLVYLFNAWLTWLVLRNNKSLSIKSAVVVALVLVALVWTGIKKGEAWKTTDAELKILLVQANIGNNEKRTIEKRVRSGHSIVESFFGLTEDGLAANPDTQLVIWPETAYPYIMDSLQKNRHQNLKAFIQKINVPLFTGAFSADPDTSTRGNIYNSVFLFDGNGEVLGKPYRKTKLLAFGEKIPLVEYFPFLAKINPAGNGSFGEGEGPMIMDLHGVHIGPQICYESLYPAFSTELSHKGTHIIINVSNDSWFGPTFEPHQHLFMTAGRSVEVRRPLIRSTNTGVSSVVLADGTVLEQSPLDAVWVRPYTVPYQKNPTLTFFAQYGAWFWVLILGMIGIIILCGKKRNA